jgi:hydroxypyruvate reductase/glycerate 2-kinase
MPINTNSILSKIVRTSISIPKSVLNKISGNIWILGAGKASVSIATELMDSLPALPKDGMLISPNHDYLDQIQIFKGSHPYPDEQSVAASYELLELAKSIPSGDTVFFCLSGGASSLLTIPPYGIEVEDLQVLYKLLLESGASIHEMNTVRKHVCELKGGKLAKVLADTNLISLIISDVPGDDLSMVGSGPTISDDSTYKDAKDILVYYQLWEKLPLSIQTHIQLGVDGVIDENPRKSESFFKNHSVLNLNSAGQFAETIRKELSGQGYSTWIAKKAYSGPIRKVAKEISAKAISVLSSQEPVKKPAALIFYGESEVHVKGSGKGGRNQELALICALSLEGQHNVQLLSIGTDGIDGPTDAAGAIIDSFTTLKARKKKLNPEEFLQNNDSYHFHEQMGTLIKTGPTGNNLMDLQVLIVE